MIFQVILGAERILRRSKRNFTKIYILKPNIE